MPLNGGASVKVPEALKIVERGDESYAGRATQEGVSVSASRSPEGCGWILDAAYMSAISALAGSVIGGFTTGFTTWLSQRSQARAGMIAHDLARPAKI
jgi:hypothetical protein